MSLFPESSYDEDMKKPSFLDSELTIDERVADLISQLTLEEKLWMITSDMHGVERLGIKPCAVGTEVARGWSSHDETQFCTVFPQTIGLAATFDKKTIKKTRNHIRVSFI